jgi:hypothetical protein
LYQTLLSDSSLYSLLARLDEDLAGKSRAKGCRCGGLLHSARYPRKPRGLPSAPESSASWDSRFSFCCARKDCRKRTTPPSFRFLGRKVFVGAVVVLMSALRHGATPKRMAMLREIVSVSRRTVERWRIWWQKDFVRSSFWRGACGLLRKPVQERMLPLSLLEAFSINAIEDPKGRLVTLLRFVLPLTTSSVLQEM